MSTWQSLFDDAPERLAEPGTVLFRREDAVRSMFFVRSGTVALERPMADGSALTLHRATGSMALAEASLFADHYHCDAVVRETAVIAVLPRPAFLSALRASPDAALSLVETCSKEIQRQRTRQEILRLRRVADRLDAWLDLYGTPDMGTWVHVADEIGVSPPALYRELSKRRGRRFKN